GKDTCQLAASSGRLVGIDVGTLHIRAIISSTEGTTSMIIAECLYGLNVVKEWGDDYEGFL
ncbi:MAG: hypothetical protein ACRDBM_13640, partial [Sporomusa sp.]